MGKPRRSFTREFKVEAVQLVTEQGRSFAEAAANLGIIRPWATCRQSSMNKLRNP